MIRPTKDKLNKIGYFFLLVILINIPFMSNGNPSVHSQTLESGLLKRAIKWNELKNKYHLSLIKLKELRSQQLNSSQNINDGLFVPLVSQREIDEAHEKVSKLKVELKIEEDQIKNLNFESQNFIEEYSFKKLPIISPEDRIKDPTKTPLISTHQVETVALLDFPAGHIALSSEGKIFLAPEYFDKRLFDKNNNIHIIELVKKNGAMGVNQNDFYFKPFPASHLQSSFQSIHAIRIDSQGWLWALDHGHLGAPLIGHPQLTAFEIKSGKKVFQYEFSNAEAPFGSFLNDMFIVNQSGATGFVVVGDTSPIAGRSGMIVLTYKIDSHGKTQVSARRVLDGHFSLMPSSYINHYYVDHKDNELEKIWKVKVGPMTIGNMRNGLDGLTLDRRNNNVYYGAANRGELFRIKLDDLIGRENVADYVERVAFTTVVDGFSSDVNGNIYITDEAHDAILRYNSHTGELETVVKDASFAWPVSVAMGLNGDVYFTCYQLPDLLYKDAEQIKKIGPYPIYKFKTPFTGPVGH